MDDIARGPASFGVAADASAPALGKATRFALWLVTISFIGSTLNFPKAFAGTTPADFFLVFSIVGFVSVGFWRYVRLPLPAWVGLWLLITSGLLAALLTAASLEPIWTVLKLIYLLAWAGLVGAVVRRAQAHEHATDLYGAVLVGSAVIVLLTSQLARAPIIGAFIPDETYRSTGTYANPNMTASFLVVAVFYLPLNRTLRGALWGVLGRIVALAALAASGSFAGVAALLVGTVWMVLGTLLSGQHPLSRRVLPICAFGVLAAMIVVSLVPSAALPLAPVADTILPGRDFASSVEDRITNTGSTLVLWHESPFWGQGAGLLGERQAMTGLPGFGGHCEYATTLAERGIIGFLGLLLLLGPALARGLRGHTSEFVSIRRLSVRHVAALLGLCAYAMSHDFIHHRQLWVVFALLWALPAAGESLTDTEAEPGEAGLDPDSGYPRDWAPSAPRVDRYP